jgi:hypothetical protein
MLCVKHAATCPVFASPPMIRHPTIFKYTLPAGLTALFIKTIAQFKLTFFPKHLLQVSTIIDFPC